MIAARARAMFDVLMSLNSFTKVYRGSTRPFVRNARRALDPVAFTRLLRQRKGEVLGKSWPRMIWIPRIRIPSKTSPRSRRITDGRTYL